MGNNVETLIEKYKLSEDEHKRVLELLKRNIFAVADRQSKPSVMFVVGQPGSGKTTFINNSNLSKYISINSDDYRHFSKYSKEILEKYPTNYAKLTNYDAHLWGDELFDYAVEKGYSVLREKAPTDYSIVELIKTIPDNYDIVLNVVIAGNIASLLATRERYEKEILESNNAKLSNVEAHNKCYELLPDFISRCVYLGATVNYVISSGAQYEVIPVGEDYLDLLQKLRKESNDYACLTYEQRISSIKKEMLSRNAPQEQFDELKKIEDMYLNVINKSNKKL